ncbi:MAG: type II secretion system F family protein [Patulibacter sp.]
MSVALVAGGAGVLAGAALCELAAAMAATPRGGWTWPLPPVGRRLRPDGGGQRQRQRQRQRGLVGSWPIIGGAALAGWLLLGWLGATVGATVGAALLRFGASHRERVDARSRERGVGAVARALADAVRAGQSIRGAFDGVAADRAVPAALRGELARVQRDLAHGVPLARALRGLAARGGSQLTLLAAVVVLHAERGGALAQELHALADDADHAVRLDEERASATAQARATVRTVAALPVLALAGAQLLGGNLLESVARRPVALALLSIGLLLEAAAVLIARRLVARAT